MTWGGDDWNWWIRTDRHGRPSAPAQFELLHEILAGVPGREIKTVAHVGRAGPSCLQFLSAHFAGVALIDETVKHVSPLWTAAEALEAETSLQTLDPIQPSCHRFDVVLAVETLARPALEDLDVVLETVRACVVEGGLLLATFPAARQERVAREMRLRGDDEHAVSPRLHEVELQYRLRRAGFRGVRIRRILDESDPTATAGESLLCMAVGRANN